MKKKHQFEFLLMVIPTGNCLADIFMFIFIYPFSVSYLLPMFCVQSCPSVVGNLRD